MMKINVLLGCVFVGTHAPGVLVSTHAPDDRGSVEANGDRWRIPQKWPEKDWNIYSARFFKSCPNIGRRRVICKNLEDCIWLSIRTIHLGYNTVDDHCKPWVYFLCLLGYRLNSELDCDILNKMGYKKVLLELVRNRIRGLLQALSEVGRMDLVLNVTSIWAFYPWGICTHCLWRVPHALPLESIPLISRQKDFKVRQAI